MTYKRAIPACLALLTGTALMAVFITPFYGVLEPVAGDAADGQSIIIEDFDYTEPGQSAAEELSATDDNPADLSVHESHISAKSTDLSAFEDTKTEEGALEASAAPAHLVPDDQPLQMLHGGIVVAAGRVEGNGRIITLDDIVVTEVGQQCRGDNLMQWDCGIYARTAFRSWLGSKILSCRLPADDHFGAEMTTDCVLGSENAAQWLVRNGWVKALEGGAYADIGRQAENAKRGIWGNKPVSLMPQLLPLSQQPIEMPSAVPNADSEQPASYFPPAPQN